MHPIFSRTRRNHGLEHATLNLLAKTHPGSPMPVIQTEEVSGSWEISRPRCLAIPSAKRLEG